MNQGDRENKDFLKMQREEFLDSMRITADVPSILHPVKSEKQIIAEETEKERRAREICEILDIVFWRDFGKNKKEK